MFEVIAEVRGMCVANYRPGEVLTIKGFYIDPKECSTRMCINALMGIAGLLSPFIHGVSAKLPGIGHKGEEYVQCLDPGKPYTCRGTRVLRVKRVKNLP